MANAPTASVPGSQSSGAQPTGSRYWIVPIVRAIVAVIPAIVITFSVDHSATFGLLVFGAYALVNGLLLSVLGWRTLGGVSRRLTLIQGIVGIVAGAASLALHGGGLAVFLYIVTVWAAVTGFVELYSGLRARGRSPFARDWTVAGVLTAVLALVFLLLPPHPVVSVGLLGAYLVVLGVFLAIAGLSLKWAPTDATPVVAAAQDSDKK